MKSARNLQCLVKRVTQAAVQLGISRIIIIIIIKWQHLGVLHSHEIYYIKKLSISDATRYTYFVLILHLQIIKKCMTRCTVKAKENILGRLYFYHFVFILKSLRGGSNM